jgi:hypothetical protein
MADPNLTPEQLQQSLLLWQQINEQKQKALQVTQDLEDEYDKIEGQLDDISKRITNQLKQQGASARQVTEIRSIYNQLNKTNKELQYLNEKFYEGSLKTKDIQTQLNKLNQTELNVRRQKVLAEDQGNKALAAKFAKEEKILANIREQGELLLEQNKTIDKSVGLTGKLLEGLEKIPVIGKFIEFDAINTSMRQAAGHTNVFAAGMKTATQQLKTGLKDPLVQLGLMVGYYKMLFDLASKHDDMLTKGAKQLSMTKDQANELYKSYSNYASTQNNAFITGKRLFEAQTQLNESLGTTVVYGKESAEAFSRLTTFYKLSAEEAGKLEKLSRLQGKNSKDVLSSTLAVAGQQKLQYGGTIAYQDVLKKVSNTSGEILTKFKGNTEALTAAIMQADRLGLSLEQVEKTADSLLNFEQSIESELKAELLTGKAINLEKARAAALSGDQVKLMNEITTQVGNIHQFEKMNVIQRKAYAEAFGMSASEMGDMLRKKEFETKLGAVAQKSAEEQLKYARANNISMSEAIEKELEQRSLAELQKDVLEKIRDILTKIVSGPMLSFFKLLEKSFNFVQSIFNTFGKMTGGALGDALGATLIGAPLLIGAIRALTSILGSGLKSMFFQRGTWPNPMITQEKGMGGGGGMLDDMIDMGGQRGGKFGKSRRLVSRFGSADKARAARASQMRGFKVGGGLAIAGLAADQISEEMKEGTEQDVVSGIGTTASFAGTGAMIGSALFPGVGTLVGGIIGGVVGGIKALVDADENEKKRIEQEKKNKEEAQNRTNELLESFLNRPIHLNVGNETLLKFNTAQAVHGNDQSSFD